MPKNYIELDVRKYVERGITYRGFKKIAAEKIAPVYARVGKVGEQIITYNKNGLETINQVRLDPETNQPDWILSKVVDGVIQLYKDGHSSEWIVSDSVFKEKYEVDERNSLLYKPKSNRQFFVETWDNICFIAPWGEKMYLQTFDYLNITDMENIYGISRDDFLQTYQILEDEKEKCKTYVK